MTKITARVGTLGMKSTNAYEVSFCHGSDNWTIGCMV